MYLREMQRVDVFAAVKERTSLSCFALSGEIE